MRRCLKSLSLAENLPSPANLHLYVSLPTATILYVYEKNIQHRAKTFVSQMGQAVVFELDETAKLSGEDS